jgi:putative membrane protein insertion efficiency factor
MCDTEIPDNHSPAANGKKSWLTSRDPQSISLWRRLLSAPLIFYKRFISPFMPPACRFEPTCSVYAIEAVEVHGLYGIWLALIRLLKCQPLHPGGYDPVPPRKGTDVSDRQESSGE